MKDSDRRTGEISERFRLEMGFACFLLPECPIGFPKTFCSIQIVREGETLLVFQLKDTKLDSGQSCSGKQLADWRKCEREQFWTGKPKLWKEQIAEQGKSWKVQTPNRFCLLAVAWIPNLVSKNILFNPNCEGRWKAAAWGKSGRFWCFLAQENLKTFFQNWCSAQFEIIPTLPIPHSLILRKNHAPSHLIKIEILT